MRILFITSRFPYPLEKGDKLRAFHQIRALSQSNEIILCALSHDRIPESYRRVLLDFCSEVHVFELGRVASWLHTLGALVRGLPMQVGYFYRPRHRRAIRSIAERRSPDIIFAQLLRSARYAEGLNITSVLDFQDCFSAGMERRREQSQGLRSAFFRLEKDLLIKYEEACFHAFDATTIITETDRDLLKFKGKENVRIIANGVDTSYFSPSEQEAEFDLLFTGNMGYPPNVDAALFLAREILPIIRKSLPGVRLCIAGADPAPVVRRLASDHIIVSGWVDDIREMYAKCRVFIAPMRIGTGLQNKLLEAMAMGKPCVTTSLANTPLGAQEGKEILCGDDAVTLAAKCIQLLNEAQLSQQVARDGLSFLKTRYSWDSAATELEAVFRSQKSEV